MKTSFLSITLLFFSVTVFLFIGCNKNQQYKKDLNFRNHPTVIMEAAYELGESGDTSAILPLLTGIMDMRMSTNIHYKGMTICYGRLMALRKISGVQPNNQLNQFSIDTAAVFFYLRWAKENGYVKSGDNVNLNNR